MVVEFGVRPLFEAVAEDDDAAAGRDLEIQLNMPVSEDIVVPVVLLLLLIFGEENELLFVLTLVRTRVGYLFESAFLCPLIAEVVAPFRR